MARSKHTLKIWDLKKYDYILTAGGIGHKKDIQTIPVGKLMKQWLIKKGISKDRILSENRSLETYTNVHYSLQLLQRKNIKIKSFTVVSVWSHIIRIKIILWRNYKLKAISAPVWHNLKLLEWILEPIWLINSLVDKSGNGLLRKSVRRYVKKRRLF